jgi:CDP-paratose 2-epimerase
VRENLSRTAGEVFNVGGGSANTTSLLELIDRIEEFSGAKVDSNFANARPGDQMFYVSNHDKLTRMTGWTPKTSLPETVQKIARWRKANQGLFGRAPEESVRGLGDLVPVQEPA